MVPGRAGTRGWGPFARAGVLALYAEQKRIAEARRRNSDLSRSFWRLSFGRDSAETTPSDAGRGVCAVPERSPARPNTSRTAPPRCHGLDDHSTRATHNDALRIVGRLRLLAAFTKPTLTLPIGHWCGTACQVVFPMLEASVLGRDELKARRVYCG
jgi:hypothetical protein